MLVYGKTNGEDWDTSKERLSILDNNACMISKYKTWIPQICQVSIETVNRCNGECEFCPANKNTDTRKPELMSEKLFYKILSELEDMNYKGIFCLNINNEPLLDNRCVSFAKTIRERFPENYIVIYTNGTLLSDENLSVLLENVSEVYIDNYSEDLKIIPQIKDVLLRKWKLVIESKVLVRLVCVTPKAKMLNRGGIAPNQAVKPDEGYLFNHPCGRVFWELCITPNGDVIACCHDVRSRIVLGNVKEQSIEEVWNGERYCRLRKMMLENKRSEIEMCNVCDQISVREAFDYFNILHAFDAMMKDVSKNKNIVIPAEDGMNRDYCMIEDIMRTIGCPYSRKDCGENNFYLFATYEDAKKYSVSDFFICSDIISAFNEMREKQSRHKGVREVLLKRIRSQRLKRRIRKE